MYENKKNIYNEYMDKAKFLGRGLREGGSLYHIMLSFVNCKEGKNKKSLYLTSEMLKRHLSVIFIANLSPYCFLIRSFRAPLK